MIEHLKNALMYCLLGLGALGFIIIYGSLRAKGFNWYIFGAGVICLAIPVVYYFLAELFSNTNDGDSESIDLKQSGIAVPVDLTKCKIKSNGWTTEVLRYDNPRVAFLNQISGHGDKNVERVESNLSVIEFTTKVNGRTRKFRSPPIGKDKISLAMLLEMKKETTIYLDPGNSRNYYFDLAFLQNEG